MTLQVEFKKQNEPDRVERLEKCDAIVVNYNAGLFLAEAVSSLQLESIDRIIIVDNASSDDSLVLAEKAAAPGKLTVIRNPRNLGFAAACNIGAKASVAPYLFFFNPDCTLAEGALQHLMTVLTRDEDIGMVGGLLCNPDGTEQAGGRRVVPTPRRAFVRAFGLSRLAEIFPTLFSDFLLHKQPLPAEPVSVEAISGACMLVKREAVERVGLWDEGYFLHCEDLDWCMRFRQEGYQVVFVPDARVFHHRGACSQSRPIFVEWHKHRGMLRFYNKFFKDTYSGLLMGLVAMAVWSRFIAIAGWHCTQILGRYLYPRSPASSSSTVSNILPQLQATVGDPGKSVLLTGATSQIARFLLPRLLAQGYTVHALSRQSVDNNQARVVWHRVDISMGGTPDIFAETLIHLAPLPLLPPLLAKLPEGSLKHVIAFGSTSRFSKANSGDPEEKVFARALADAEAEIAAYCEPRGIAWAVFRPTLIYGCGIDRNIAVITRFIQRFRFFPVIGDALGHRQPVHADDLAKACLAILDHPQAFNRAYDLSGGETLSYRAMVERIFVTEGIKPHFLRIPLPLFQGLMEVASWLPTYRTYSGEMASRMAVDLCFDNAPAMQAFGYDPRPFEPPHS